MRKAVVILMLACFEAAAAGASPDPTALIAEIDAKGAQPVLTRLFNDAAMFDTVLSHIESGEPSWLEVARRLKPASDAGASLSLNFAVAFALPKSPERVLALIGAGFQTDEICTSPYLEPSPGVAEKYQGRTLGALRKVNNPKLNEVRDRCLEGVGIQLKPQ